MAAGTLDLTIEQGATFEEPLVWKSGGVPVDLTGYTARMQIRAAIASTEVLESLTTENARIVLGTIDGSILLTMPAADTTLITWVKGVYDLELVSPVGVVRRLLQGKVKVSPEVTR